MKYTEIMFKSQGKTSIPHRIYYMSKEGLHIGGNPISSNFTWRNCQRVARGILRAWAQDLVAGHDSAQLCATLHQWAKDWTEDYGIKEDDPAIVGPSPPNALLSRLWESNIERKACFRQRFGKRDGTVMFYLSKEIIEAVGYCLKRIGVKPRIQWEVESLPHDVGIYHILLEGGKHQ